MRNRRTTTIILAALAANASLVMGKPSTAVGTRPTQEARQAEKREAQDQEKRVRMQDLPAPVQQTVREQSKGATLRGLAQETEGGQVNYEAEFKVNGHNRDVLIDPSGAIVEIEEQVTLDSVPPEVRATIEKAAATGKISEVESITKNGVIVAYEAHIRTAGRKSEVKVKPDGSLATKE